MSQKSQIPTYYIPGEIIVPRRASGHSMFRGESQAPHLPHQPTSTIDELMEFETTVASERYVAIYDPYTSQVIEEVLLAKGGEFPAKVPLLDNHLRHSVQNVLGVAFQFRQRESVWAGQCRLTRGVRESEDAYRKVADGALQDVSIGYGVLDAQMIRPGESARIDGRLWRAGDLPVRVATRWKVRELSLTAIGADVVAKVRLEQAAMAKTPVHGFIGYPKPRHYFR